MEFVEPIVLPGQLATLVAALLGRTPGDGQCLLAVRLTQHNGQEPMIKPRTLAVSRTILFRPCDHCEPSEQDKL